VLVHGYFANRGYFRPLVRRLEAAGVGPVFVPNLRSWHATIERFEAQLSAQLERIAAGCGRRVVVIAHSMGGLGIRAHLARHGDRYVERVITIASPHHGTALGAYGIGANARQMCPGSAFLADLERREAASPPAVPLLSIWSAHDNLVAPQESSRLPWARHEVLAGLGHLEIVHSPAVLAILRRELRGA
jgi:pimeloyl-ACP methyl ester carboxylesterase